MKIYTEGVIPEKYVDLAVRRYGEYNKWYRKLWRMLNKKRYKKIISVDVMDSLVYSVAGEKDKKTGHINIIDVGEGKDQ